jgi:hypothetical protein
MVQIRVMGDDAERVTAVLDVLLPLVRSCTALHVGDVTELRMRGGRGRRVVFDLTAAGPGPVRVERVDCPEPGGPPARRRARGALPPAGR